MALVLLRVTSAVGVPAEYANINLTMQSTILCRAETLADTVVVVDVVPRAQTKTNFATIKLFETKKEIEFQFVCNNV